MLSAPKCAPDLHSSAVASPAIFERVKITVDKWYKHVKAQDTHSGIAAMSVCVLAACFSFPAPSLLPWSLKALTAAAALWMASFQGVGCI